MGQTTTQKWLKGCGIGCGVAIVLGIVLIVGGSLTVMGPFRDAISVREQLDERFGDQTAYTPPADGTIPPARLQAFIGVREQLAKLCPGFAAVAEKIGQMDELPEDAPKLETFSTVLTLTKDMIGMGPRLGEFYRTRNQALLETGMGRGEYTYIYLVAYHDQLLSKIRFLGGTPQEHYEPGRRINEVCARILDHQAAAVRAQLASADDPELAAFADLLDAEAARVAADPEAWLWQNGLPAPIAASVAADRARLDDLFCEHTVELEFTRNRQRGLSIQGD